MPEYKFYCMNDAGHIVKRHDIVVADDVAALERAKEICSEYAIELWERARFIAHVSKDGTASKFPTPKADERTSL